jgi:hypothetical protein
VVEPRGAEVVAQLVGEPLVLAQHDTGDHRPPVALQAGRDRPCEPRPEPVGDTRRPTALADSAPAGSAQDDVHTAPAQQRPLVEAVLRAAGTLDLRNHVQLGALRGRAAGRQLQEDRLVEAVRSEALDLSGNPDLVATAPGGTRHDHLRPSTAPDFVPEPAGVERVEPRTPPPPARKRQREREECDPTSAADDERRERHGYRRRGRDPGAAKRVRDRDPHTESAGQQKRGRPKHESRHGVTASRSCSMRAGPIPGTASSSSTDAKPPFCAR